MNEDIFDTLIDGGKSERLDQIFLQDEGYQKLEKELDQQSIKMDKCDFSKEEKSIIDEVISAYTAFGAHYARLSYKQGYKDCVNLLKEIGLIKVQEKD